MTSANTTNGTAVQTTSWSSGTIGLGPSRTVTVSWLFVAVVVVVAFSSLPSPPCMGLRTTAKDPPCCVTVALSTIAPSRNVRRCGWRSSRPGSEAEEDEDDEADQRERLGEGDAEEHGRADHAGGL